VAGAADILLGLGEFEKARRVLPPKNERAFLSGDLISVRGLSSDPLSDVRLAALIVRQLNRDDLIIVQSSLLVSFE
jgi:hypothetical protein